ncbi:MAG: gamma-glutamyltransferase family protein [Spirochaetaceae bacterium]|nr:MAG: gamma-glutamyltransferase family protein [Spirochaetaceae bacterium]
MKLLSSEQYVSRRSPVLATRGMVATSQPLATLAGVDILRSGGNAADAAVAAAAALQVTQPCSTGLGGDCFVLYFSADRGTVEALNGSGRSPGALTLEAAIRAGFRDRLPPHHPFTVTVPGAPAAWVDAQTRFGRLNLQQVLAPAIDLAEHGFPVGPLTAGWWREGVEQLLSRHAHGGELMIDGRGPRAGEVVRLPTLASSLQILADQGKEPFYRGEIAEKIVAAVAEAGGVLALDDLAAHESQWVKPIRTRYRDFYIWECPPNGHGLAVLLALNILQACGFSDAPASGADRLHLMIEAMRLAFADVLRYVGDPGFSSIPVAELLGEWYARHRAAAISMKRTMEGPVWGDPLSTGSAQGDTVYFCVSDAEGNACSFINSNFLGFGTGIVPQGCGYSLQNRGYGFVLDSEHPNGLAPAKRSYHTIIPGLSTHAETGGFHSVFGVMGGMMQPQGHLQVVSALIDDELDPQAALDRGRFQLEEGLPDGEVLLEDSLDPETAADLQGRGHRIRILFGLNRPLFGLGQIILKGSDGVYWGGSDPRGDGCALGLA